MMNHVMKNLGGGLTLSRSSGGLLARLVSSTVSRVTPGAPLPPQSPYETGTEEEQDGPPSGPGRGGPGEKLFIENITGGRKFPSPSEVPPHMLVFDGVPFSDLPIAHVKASYNNTIINITDSAGKRIVLKSCGTEGFKNAKKSTSVAAQTTGIACGSAAMKKGVSQVRVKVSGLGAGRLSSLKGLQMSGVNIISITDDTPHPHGGARPRKARRL